MTKQYEEITIRSFKDDEMAGMVSRNRERGKWFVHGINEHADLLGVYEEKEEAIEEAKEHIEESAKEGDVTTGLIVKNLESEIEKRETIDITTITPEEADQK